MKGRMDFFIALPLVILLTIGLSGCGNDTISTEKLQEKHWENREDWNAVKPGEFVIEPPTLICLGFEWYIEGDANHNATVEVWYRKKGESSWKKALPLLRIQNEECIDAFSVNWIFMRNDALFALQLLCHQRRNPGKSIYTGSKSIQISKK